MRAATRSNAFTAAGFKSAGPAADADRSDYKTADPVRAGQVQPGLHGGARRRHLEPARSRVGEADARRRRLLIVGTDYSTLKHRFDLIPPPLVAPPSTASTTSTTVGRADIDHDDHRSAAPRSTPASCPSIPRRAARWSGVPNGHREDALAADVPAPPDHRVRHRGRVDRPLPSRARTPRPRTRSRRSRRPSIDTSVLQSRRQLPAHRLRLARVRRQPAGSAALRQPAATDRSAVRHDHGRPHRRQDRAPRCSCRSRATSGSSIPGIGNAKINAAFNAGPQRVIETIENDFDIPISHYLQVDFAGFRKMVNAIGTIPIYFPAPARDEKSGLAVNKAGCQQLERRSGARVRAVALLRVVREREVASRTRPPTSAASSASSTSCARSPQETLHAATAKPWKASSLLDSMLSDLQRDPQLGLSSLRALAYAFHQPGGVETQTLPVNRQFFERARTRSSLDSAKAAPDPRPAARDRQSVEPTGPVGVDPGTDPRRGRERQRPQPASVRRRATRSAGSGSPSSERRDQRRPQRLHGDRGPLRLGRGRPRPSSCSPSSAARARSSR